MPLSTIAADMKRTALHNVYDPRMEPQHKMMFQRRLMGGVLIQLVILGSDWHLSLARKNVPPSEIEIRVFEREFKVPDVKHIKHEERKGYHIVVIDWALSREQPPVSPATPPAHTAGMSGDAPHARSNA